VRSGASVTLLVNGMVLFAGGYDGTQYLSSAEIYDTSTGTFTVIAGSLNTPRAGQSGTMLSNGKVLIAGGANSAGYLTSAELYDPSTGTFTFTGSMHTPRASHSATALASGEVLLAAGENSSSNGGYVGSAELCNPSTVKFGTRGSLKTAYEIIAGDWSSDVCSSDLLSATTSARSRARSCTIPRRELSARRRA